MGGVQQLLLAEAATAAGGASDPFFANVKLLMGFNGANGSTGAPGMADESSAARGVPLTISGSAQIDTSQFKFGVSSLKVTTSSYITYPDSADWILSSANSDQFTVEFWIRLTSIGTNKVFISQYINDGSVAWSMQTGGANSDEFQFYFSPNGTFASAVGTFTTGAALSTTLGTWHHLAADKDASGKIRVYKNGVMLGSATPANSAIFNSNAQLAIGATAAGGGPMDGWIDEMRITKGVARYASDSGFTVPTSAFPRT